MSTLTAAERTHLATIADLIIPRSATMPSGSEADAHASYLDAVFDMRPDLLEVVRANIGASPAVLPAQLDEETATALRPTADALTAAYFLNPDVARRVGYRKRSVVPIEFDRDLDLLTEAVTDRGPIYRPTPRPEED